VDWLVGADRDDIVDVARCSLLGSAVGAMGVVVVDVFWFFE
jgi:hypothetical protein